MTTTTLSYYNGNNYSTDIQTITIYILINYKTLGSVVLLSKFMIKKRITIRTDKTASNSKIKHQIAVQIDYIKRLHIDTKVKSE
jgi:hypothetical protein